MVQIEEAGCVATPGVGNPRGATDLPERPVTLIAEQQVRACPRHEEVEVPVVVVVGKQRTEGRPGARHASFAGHVGECAHVVAEQEATTPDIEIPVTIAVVVADCQRRSGLSWLRRRLGLGRCCIQLYQGRDVGEADGGEDRLLLLHVQ